VSVFRLLCRYFSYCVSVSTIVSVFELLCRCVSYYVGVGAIMSVFELLCLVFPVELRKVMPNFKSG
jgi:hypothetical protein